MSLNHKFIVIFPVSFYHKLILGNYNLDYQIGIS